MINLLRTSEPFYRKGLENGGSFESTPNKVND
jgi:hypothetical protein